MATRDIVIERVRVLLQDEDPSAYVFPTSVLQHFADEGLRTISPVVGRLTTTIVSADGSTREFDLSAQLSGEVLQVAAVLSDESLVWEAYGDTLAVKPVPSQDFEVRALVGFTEIVEAPERVADAIVYYCSGRSLLWLTNRGGDALGRYLAQQGELENHDVSKMGEEYLREYYARREECGVSVAV